MMNFGDVRQGNQLSGVLAKDKGRSSKANDDIFQDSDEEDSGDNFEKKPEAGQDKQKG